VNLVFDVMFKLAEAATVPPRRTVPAAIVLAENTPFTEPLPETVAPVVLASTVTAYSDIASAS
jgi:hypothetical protein